MKKLLISIFLLAALMAVSTGPVFAQTTTTDLTGKVQKVELGTDPATSGPIVIVTLLDSSKAILTLNLSVAAAKDLGLVTEDVTTGKITVNTDSYGTKVLIPGGDILPDTTAALAEEEPQHPVGGALAEFFTDLLGVDYDTIMTAHNDGFGFGVIAQALWLTNQIGGDTNTFTALLEAKKSGDYSGITLADNSTPENWGDVVKSLKKGDNLGKVMSGRADGEDGNTEPPGNGKGKGKGNNGGNGNGNGNGNPGGGHGNGGGNGNGNGNGGGNGNGHGKP